MRGDPGGTPPAFGQAFRDQQVHHDVRRGGADDLLLQPPAGVVVEVQAEPGGGHGRLDERVMAEVDRVQRQVAV
jgi:hypothetical protein